MKNRVPHLSILFLALAAGCAAEADGGIPFDELPAPPELAVGKADDLASLLPGCPGVEVGLPSLDGFPGRYQRLAPFADDELMSVHIGPRSLDPDAPYTGAYSALVQREGLVGHESGVYGAIADNPAIGAVIAFDHDARPGDPIESILFDDTYFILGSRRNLFGAVSALCLIRWVEPDPELEESLYDAAFLVTRVGF